MRSDSPFFLFLKGRKALNSKLEFGKMEIGSQTCMHYCLKIGNPLKWCAYMLGLIYVGDNWGQEHVLHVTIYLLADLAHNYGFEL